MQEVKHRSNTYSTVSYFKTLVLAVDEENALEGCRFLTNNTKKLLRTDLLRCPFKDTSFVAYPRWENSVENQYIVSYEAVVIWAETEEDWNTLSKLIKNDFSKTPVRLVISNHIKAKEWSDEIIAGVCDRSNRQKALDILDELDKDECENIFAKFEEFDINKDGTISIHEMPKIAKSLGEDPNSDSLKQAMLVFDSNHDGFISFSEFICWWKVGREDSLAFSKIWGIHTFIAKSFDKLFKSPQQDLIKDDSYENKTKQFSTNLNVDTKNIDDYITRLNLRCGIGGNARKEACKNYLSRYNDKMEYQSDNFINISIFVKSCTIEGESTQNYIERFKDEIIDKFDRDYIPGLKTFLDNFLVVKFYAQDYSANLHFEFKYDINELLKNTMVEVLSLTNWLTNDGKNPLDFDLQFFAGKCLGDLVNKKATIGDLLHKSETKLIFKALKDKFGAILRLINPEFEDYINLLKPLCTPTNIKLKYEGPLNEMLDDTSKELMSRQLTIFENLLEFAKKNIPKDLREVMSRIEIGVNLFDIFASAQLFSEHLWVDDHHEHN